MFEPAPLVLRVVLLVTLVACSADRDRPTAPPANRPATSEQATGGSATLPGDPAPTGVIVPELGRPEPCREVREDTEWSCMFAVDPADSRIRQEIARQQALPPCGAAVNLYHAQLERLGVRANLDQSIAEYTIDRGRLLVRAGCVEGTNDRFFVASFLPGG
jgi:hypothetical protein